MIPAIVPRWLASQRIWMFLGPQGPISLHTGRACNPSDPHNRADLSILRATWVRAPGAYNGLGVCIALGPVPGTDEALIAFSRPGNGAGSPSYAEQIDGSVVCIARMPQADLDRVPRLDLPWLPFTGQRCPGSPPDVALLPAPAIAALCGVDKLPPEQDVAIRPWPQLPAGGPEPSLSSSQTRSSSTSVAGTSDEDAYHAEANDAPSKQGRNADEVFALRQAYWRNRYRPVAIYTRQKRPRGDGWRADALQDPPLWAVRYPEDIARSTGIVTGTLTGVDVDVLIQEVTDRIVWEIEQIAGPTPLVRMGSVPKTLLGFRCENPFRKLSTGAFIMPDDSEAKVEILADGQQLVADGIHPDTHLPYVWPDGSPETVPLADAPPITLEQAQSVIARARELIIANGGVEKKPPPHRPSKGDGVGHSADTFFAKVNEAALRNLAAWVKALFPKAAYQPGTGAWRVASKDRGRPDLQEDISLHPDGIQDFGLEIGLTPIDVVIEWGGAPDAIAAAKWLCSQLGIDPAALGWREGRYPADPAADPNWWAALAAAVADEQARGHGNGRAAPDAPPPQPDAGGGSGDSGSGDGNGGPGPGTGKGSNTNPQPFRRATIKVIKGEYVAAAEQIETVALAAKLPIYSHGDTLCRPVTEQRKRHDGKTVTVAVLRAYKAPSLRRVIDLGADFVKWNAKGKRFVPCEPPAEIINMVLAGEQKQIFPPIRGIIGTPIIRPDLTISSVPGYDPETGYFLVDPPGMPDIPDQPTREDAEKGLALLDDLLSEFPFVDEVSRSVAYSGLITPLVRAACAVVPGHLFTAPQQGAGKSLLVDLASAIATGEPAYAILAHRQPEEQDKQITSALIEARQIIALDNLTGEIESAVLAQTTERERISLRPLGTSQPVAVVNTFNTYLTGNNAIVAGDNTRRILVARIDPKVETPLDRTFQKPNPLARVFQDRGKYVAAIFTIVRAYIATGRSNPLTPTPSYADWSRLVREPLTWLGLPDPTDSMRAAASDDPKNATLAALMAAWPNTHPDWTTAELVAEANKVDPRTRTPLRPALAEALNAVARNRRGFLDPTTLGYYLRANRDRIIGGLMIQRTPTANDKNVARWKVVSASK